MTCKEHEWVVFSTALDEGWLMLQCVNCGLHATVDDPSKKEWSKAFYAPSKPYRWHDQARVGIHEEHPTDQRYVQKKPPAPRNANAMPSSACRSRAITSGSGSKRPDRSRK